MTPCCFVSFLPPKSFVHFWRYFMWCTTDVFWTESNRGTSSMVTSATRSRVLDAANLEAEVENSGADTDAPASTTWMPYNFSVRHKPKLHLARHVTSRHDTTRMTCPSCPACRARRDNRVKRVVRSVLSALWRACWALRDERVKRVVTSVSSASWRACQAVLVPTWRTTKKQQCLSVKV